MEGPRRPENGSLSPGVMWEPPTGEASISLSPVFCLPPPLQMAILGGGGDKSPLFAPGKQFLKKATWPVGIHLGY